MASYACARLASRAREIALLMCTACPTSFKSTLGMVFRRDCSRTCVTIPELRLLHKRAYGDGAIREIQCGCKFLCVGSKAWYKAGFNERHAKSVGHGVWIGRGLG